MGPTDLQEPATGDESVADESSTVMANCHKHDDESSADEGAAEADEMSACMQRQLGESGEEEEECADAEADEMAASMQRRVHALPGKAHESEPFTIFRVAGPMRDRNSHLYEPQMVSVGPFHRGAARLRAMEEHKWRYLRDLLARNPADAPLASYTRAARALEPAARRRYAEPVPLTAREFAEMLLLDGCFIVEFFLKGEDRAADALIDAAWAMQNVYNDLFLLENQLPFFVVERFYDIATGGLGRDYLVTNLLAKYLTIDTPQDAATARAPDGEILHLLHLYYHWFLPPEDRTNDSGGGSRSGMSSKEEDEAWDEWLAKPIHERMPWQMPPATALKDAGVSFRAKRSPRSLVDITFNRRDGVMEIPTVESYTNRAMLANLVAYEQSRGRWELQRVASYVLLMASVADGRRDVEVLQRAGVLAKGDDETAAFYAHLCPPLDAVNNCYGEMYRDVREYCGRSWNRHRAVLVHDYFSNPWTSMSAAAAVLLLVLTVVQTVYTVLPYYHHN
ncbi:hypothetical protein E2562_026250 [Oryza meyeriana var. granulata]|uniref:Uncharacterized protein n=1 Tax=Oryza meyeriana var. granulata TaxID=110450 RepID=A0A6G1CIM3_9ORYZ|nr:hypothetical protein E2562_026250 [Oryza meyeriana var. granulata]